MARKVMQVLVDVKRCVIETVVFEPELREYYKLLGCTCISIVDRKIGEYMYSIICDDEVLLKSNPIVSAINNDGEIMHCGNLLVTKHNDEGCDIGITREDVRRIISNVGIVHTKNRPFGSIALLNMSY